MDEQFEEAGVEEQFEEAGLEEQFEEAGVERLDEAVVEKFEEAYNVGMGSASEELEDADLSRRIITTESRDDDPEAGVSWRDLTSKLGRMFSRQRESTSSPAGESDEEGFIVKAPGTESKYRVRRAITEEGLNSVPEGLTPASPAHLDAAEPRHIPTLPPQPTARTGRTTQFPNTTSSTQPASATDENTNSEVSEIDETREKLQNIRVKFLRLAHRLGQSPQNQVVAQVLYRLGLAESMKGGSASNRGAFSFDRANALAEEAEATHQERDLDFACTILVLGKTGVGKSATINSIFDERKSVTSAFCPSTKKVNEIAGTVHGIKVSIGCPLLFMLIFSQVTILDA